MGGAAYSRRKRRAIVSRTLLPGGSYVALGLACGHTEWRAPGEVRETKSAYCGHCLTRGGPSRAGRMGGSDGE